MATANVGWPALGPDVAPCDVAASFHRDGFVVLEGLLPLPLVDELRSAALDNFDRCLVSLCVVGSSQ